MTIGLEKRFTYHPPRERQTEKYVRIRTCALVLAELVDGLCPEGREKSLALTKVEEAVMWANAAVARGE